MKTRIYYVYPKHLNAPHRVLLLDRQCQPGQVGVTLQLVKPDYPKPGRRSKR